MNATIGENGVPQKLMISSGNLWVAASALNAIRLRRYKPAHLSGKPVEAQIEIIVEFQRAR